MKTLTLNTIFKSFSPQNGLNKYIIKIINNAVVTIPPITFALIVGKTLKTMINTKMQNTK